MKIIENSKLFTRWKNPSNGVESLILTNRVAPVQQSFYYTTTSVTNDGRYLWFRCGFPPEGGMHAVQVLGVADLEKNEVRVYHDTQFPTAAPAVDPSSGEVYWGSNLDIWKRGPQANDKPVLVNSFPRELAKGRIFRLATHLTFSPDYKSLNIDALFTHTDANWQQRFFIGDLPLDGSPFRLWQRIDGMHHDHALFSPTDPDVQMFAHEYWQDHIHDKFDHDLPYHRMWIIRRGGKAEPVLRDPGVSHSGHEWWDADGKHVWYVHYGVAVKKVNLETREETVEWPGALSHAYSDRSGKYLVADLMADPVVSDCHVAFRNLETGKVVEIVNRPPLAKGVTQCTHLHPHPQFCLNDEYICYTTTVHDRVDVALVKVDQLIEKTK